MAAQSAVSVEIAGLREVQDKMTQVTRDMAGSPMLEAMRDSTLLVVRDARKNAPVDTGRLRASIVPEVRRRERTIEGIVGSNVVYAPYMELGTRPHWPPMDALEVWARRHGTSAFIVARAISRRGTKALHYLKRAVDSNLGKIKERLSKAVSAIVERK